MQGPINTVTQPGRVALRYLFTATMGLTVEVRLYKPMDGAKQFIGTLTGFENGVIEIEDASGKRSFEQKGVAQIRPFVDVDKELDDSKDLL